MNWRKFLFKIFPLENLYKIEDIGSLKIVLEGFLRWVLNNWFDWSNSYNFLKLSILDSDIGSRFFFFFLDNFPFH